jgi:hypothetical protein
MLSFLKIMSSLNQMFYTDEINKVINEKGDDFEMCFFHCLSRLPDKMEGKDLERVKWISSTKCYLIHVDNMKSVYKYFSP